MSRPTFTSSSFALLVLVVAFLFVTLPGAFAFQLSMLKEVQKWTRQVPKINPDGLRNIAKDINAESKPQSQLTDIDALEKMQTDQAARGTGVDKFLEAATKTIGKTPSRTLQSLILKLGGPPVEGAAPLPELTDDFEELASAALDLTWRTTNGDWTKMLELLESELGETSRAADAAITECVNICNTLTESDLKTLIIKNAPEGINALPKLDKKKYEGKFLKADYLAETIDVLRQLHGNDYVKVAAILAKEKKGGKGFGASASTPPAAAVP